MSSNTNTEELLKERTELFDNAFEFKHNKRAAVAANIYTWKMLDSGYKMSEALYDYDIMRKCFEEFADRYQFDAYCDVNNRNAFRVARAAGGGHYKIDDNDEGVYIEDHHYMEADEYPELIADQDKFVWEKVVKRALPDGITKQTFYNIAVETAQFMQYYQEMIQNAITKHGALMLFPPCTIMAPSEILFSYYRGIKGLSVDLRRNKELVSEAMDVIFEKEVAPMKGMLLSLEGKRPAGFASDILLPMLSHSILSPKQFEKFYWPYFKKVVDFAAAHHLRITVMAESTIARFTDFLQEVPKGTMMMLLEQDNLAEIRKKLPNIAIAGGMPTELLGSGTEQECIDYAKKLIDEMGDGFVLSQNKMVTFRRDAKRENLIAVNNFVRNYSI